MQSDNDIEMPEAVAYIAAADLPLLKHGIAPISAEPTTPDDIALHTADQLRAAVRAAVLRERERGQAEARIWEARYTELKKLVDRRPANNAGLFQTYPAWNGECYAFDYFDALDDAAIRSMGSKGNG